MKKFKEWKSVSQETGYHVQTLKKYNATFRLSYRKTRNSQQGRIETTELEVRDWLDKLGKSYYSPRRATIRF